MYVLGIDPGLGGALALVRDRYCFTTWDMPTVARSTKGKQVSAAGLCEILREMNIVIDGDESMRPDARINLSSIPGPPRVHCYLERVAARPGQGVVSMFGFGRSVGVIEGVLAAQLIPVTLVTSSSWKRAVGLIGSAKDMSRTRALELYPSCANQLVRKRDVGRAEAMLIAHYGEAFAR